MFYLGVVPTPSLIMNPKIPLNESIGDLYYRGRSVSNSAYGFAC